MQIAVLTSVANRLRGFTAGAVGHNLLIGALAFVAAAISIAVAPGVAGYLGAAFALIAVAIAAVDGRSFIIPDSLNLLAFTLALAHAAVQDPDAKWFAMMLAIARGSTLALIFLALQRIYSWAKGRAGIGLGDVKLAGVAGAWLDWPMMPIAVQVAALAALFTYLLKQRSLGRPVSATTKLPFGLFFAPAIWFCWILEQWLGRL